MESAVESFSMRYERICKDGYQHGLEFCIPCVELLSFYWASLASQPATLPYAWVEWSRDDVHLMMPLTKVRLSPGENRSLLSGM